MQNTSPEINADREMSAPRIVHQFRPKGSCDPWTDGVAGDEALNTHGEIEVRSIFLVPVEEGIPVMWYEVEESARGKTLPTILRDSCLYSARTHRTKPDTGNPLWALYASPVELPGSHAASHRAFVSIDYRLSELLRAVDALEPEIADLMAEAPIDDLMNAQSATTCLDQRQIDTLALIGKISASALRLAVRAARLRRP